jgi:DNA-binding response OmpR family regulator
LTSIPFYVIIAGTGSGMEVSDPSVDLAGLNEMRIGTHFAISSLETNTRVCNSSPDRYGMPESSQMGKDLKKVLIVDDEETLTWSMAKSLSRDIDKYQVIVANSGREALNTLKANRVDLVISDIRMPDINGLDLLLKIKKDHPQTKVIIMTAYGSSDVQKEASRRGSLFYIEKPFEIADIRKIIIDVLGRKKGFRGKVFGLQLTDIIQMNCLGRLTTALVITQEGEKGTIYFNEGEVVHAECGDQQGTDAFYRILSWDEGEFISNIGVTPPIQTIHHNWEHLLVEAVRRNDDNGS